MELFVLLCLKYYDINYSCLNIKQFSCAVLIPRIVTAYEAHWLMSSPRAQKIIGASLVLVNSKTMQYYMRCLYEWKQIPRTHPEHDYMAGGTRLSANCCLPELAIVLYNRVVLSDKLQLSSAGKTNTFVQHDTVVQFLDS